MDYKFEIISDERISEVVPLVFELNEGRISKDILYERFSDMILQNYKCAGIYYANNLIGVTGLWFCTRHYIGKSVELDHVYILEEYRGKGLGKKFMNWINAYCVSKGYNSTELNTYVSNYPSHKFYYNEGFEILGYHFLKKL